jgi:hypothetical protein
MNGRAVYRRAYMGMYYGLMYVGRYVHSRSVRISLGVLLISRTACRISLGCQEKKCKSNLILPTGDF